MEKIGSYDDSRKEYRSWEKSTKGADGLTHRVCVSEAENGFVVKKITDGFIEDKGEYIHECKKYISTTNPLEGKTEKKKSGDAELKNAIKDMVKAW